MKEGFEGSIEKWYSGRAGLLKSLWDGPAEFPLKPWRKMMNEWASLSDTIQKTLVRSEIGPEIKSEIKSVRPSTLDKSADSTDSKSQKNPKRLLFFEWDIQARCQSLGFESQSTEKQKFLVLQKILFEQLGFKIDLETELNWANFDSLLLEPVLLKRKIHPTCFLILVQWLLETLGMQLQVRSFTEKGFLLTSENGFESFWLQNNTELQIPEFELSQWSESLALKPSELWIEVLNALKRAASGQIKVLNNHQGGDLNFLWRVQLLLLDQLLAFKPSMTQTYAERAFVKDQLQNSESALNDLQRYFSFHEFQNAPESLKLLYQNLLKKRKFRPDLEFE